MLSSSLQIERGGHVLFEHPWAATSWNEPCFRKLLAIDGMRRVRYDQCQFRMTSVDDAGNVGPARKATVFMTNDENIAEAVDRRCFGGHDHIQLLNGRAKACEKYPLRLVAAIPRALRQSEPRDAAKHTELEAGPTLEEPQLRLPDNTTDAQEFRHRSTVLPLNPEMVKRARELEMQYMDELKVLQDSDRDACMAQTGRPPIPTDWVDKGDSLRPNYRSRLVCQ